MILVFLFVYLPAVKLQDFQDQCPGRSCHPQLGDLLVGRAAQLSASSTCGLDGPQNYCIVGYLEGEQKCFTCDSRLPFSIKDNPLSHRIENVISNFDFESRMKWWQSENGVHQVSIRLDLETIFQFSHLVLTFKTFRPTAMLVERSKDFGKSWKTFRYFADDCSIHFPSVPAGSARFIDDVFCDSRYSGPEPSTGGEVVLKALDPVFEIENPYDPKIQELITVTNIRVNFTHLYTLGDTLLARRRRNPQEKYYYSLSSMVVQGSCFCNGHASRCVPVDGGRGDVFTEPGMIHGRCVCQHNTAGENCERCQSLYNDSPWRPGGENTDSICRRCNCHGHSDSCHFDAARYDATRGVSGGVCDDCRHDRTGPQCEHCRPFMYQDPQRALEDPQACIPCDCDPAGSLNGGLCDASSGRCFCKENVEGPHCDRCKHGFFNLRQENPTGCDECKCHRLGSVGPCDQLTGSCKCEPMATGPLCDQCVAGFWGLGNSMFRCSPCDCDVGGAHSNMCSSEDGQCHCLPNMIGRRCSDPAPGYFLPSLNYFLYEAELAVQQAGGNSSPSPPSRPSPSSSPLVNPSLLPPCEQYYRNQGYDFKVSNGKVVLVRKPRRLSRQRRQQNINRLNRRPLQILPHQGSPEQSGTGLGLVRVTEGVGLTFTVDNLPTSMEYHLVIRYESESVSDWLATVRIIKLSPGDEACSDTPTGSLTLILPRNSRLGILDSRLCLNAGGRYNMEIFFDREQILDNSPLLVDSMGLIQIFDSVQNFCSHSDFDSLSNFRCVGLDVYLGSQESLPKICEGLIKSLSARIHNGAVACRCNSIGSLGSGCSKLGGFCECQRSVIGRCCDACAPLHFGFGPEGCKRCECDPRGSLSEACDVISGQCDCRPQVTGQRCDRCESGFWGFPLCQPCDCNDLSETCDGETGTCLNCREHSTGPHCNRCVEGYYGNPVSRQSCQPCLCPDILSSGRFFASSCQYDEQSLSVSCSCREGHAGPQCDRCSPGFYGDLTLPGATCKVCSCNNNIDPNSGDACDTKTGECLRCLYHTTGPQCQFCKPGFYGNALQHNCKECSCDRRGTEPTLCPLESPCFCNRETGQCPCRTGVVGDLCDECEDGFWNLDGASGCQPCSCDPANSVSNVCNKVSGQCLCRPEFGGRQCDECGENHFGNPDLQCFSCDCNLEGTERPSCDPETGECICRIGVTGILCDECAPGHSSEFPACERCHECSSLWAVNVTDVQRAAQRMRTLIPLHGDTQDSTHSRYWQWMLEMHSRLDRLANMTRPFLPKLENVEKLYIKIRRLKDTVDTNIILIDPSLLLNTDIDNIYSEFMKLLKNLKDQLIKVPNEKQTEQVEEMLEEIQKLHKIFMSDEKRLRNSSKAVEDSMDTRQELKRKLSMCKGRGPMAALEKKVKELSVLKLNQKVCGQPDPKDCSKCPEGQICDGAVPASQKALEMEEKVKQRLVELPLKLRESERKMQVARLEAQSTKDQAQDLQRQIRETSGSLEMEKNRTRELLQRVKQYLMDEMVPPEDIKKMANAVLSIHLPRSPAEIRRMISEIYNLLNSVTKFPDELKKLQDKAKTAQELLLKATEIKEKTKNINVVDISRDLYAAEELQNRANDDLEVAVQDRDMAKDQIQEMENKLDSIEPKLKNWPSDLQEEIEAVKNKTEKNREMAREAREAAESAFTLLPNKAGLQDVEEQFQLLKQKQLNQTIGGEAADRLKRIQAEAEDMQRQMEDRLRQLQDVEQKIQQLLQRKNQKVEEVSNLLKIVESLQKEIASRAIEYSRCAP
ncbi:PREDICTED: laminin subunit beta-4-like isoform X1 [Cyprinodon variegatus]|uniref:laminin subunit beta-4-like isoform X1 n=1 Tax=Cyprinodon variegatus TaxID=28743 RepID=UPI0007427BC4|nr:PREDICTED: laminin subunit beta-4-like isoform X1 [Cyprinodon variegatus]